jgi:steroid delta-isomerase-like uncharacterized protein
MPVGRAMSAESTREVIARWTDSASAHSEASVLADDVVFTTMATGEEARGPEEVLQSLNYFYHVAFEAHAEPKTMVIDEGTAAVEGDFVGEHIGEFAGIPPTHNRVRVPLCVVYEVENDKIKRARIYFEMPALFQQLGVEGP